jgi:hypothetical protein
VSDASYLGRSTQGIWPLQSLNFFMADLQAGSGPFLGVFLLAHGWKSGLIGSVMTIGGVAGMLMTAPAGALIDTTTRKRLYVVVPGICVILGCLCRRRDGDSCWSFFRRCQIRQFRLRKQMRRYDFQMSKDVAGRLVRQLEPWLPPMPPKGDQRFAASARRRRARRPIEKSLLRPRRISGSFCLGGE